jgi:hypothetical protein
LTHVSEVRTASIIIALMMKAVRTSETSAHFNMTIWRYSPETLNFILAAVTT